ncbi:hypothetical protein [Pendulispora albinea]|uniref:PEGA domain-containing protein n=1 Tax=Pendulispora albinea TaxID=2741071 RepID=A0ABZ2MA90_9BACT
MKRGDAETARLEFYQSYAAVPSPKVLWNLLVAEIDSNRPLEALRHLEAYLADPRAEPWRKEQGRGLVIELKGKVAHLQIRAPDAVFVAVDGRILTNVARGEHVDVHPGRHVVEASFDGGTHRIDVDAPAGNETVVSFEVSRNDDPMVEPSVRAAPPAKVLRASGAAPSASPPPRSSRGLASPPAATWVLGGVTAAALGVGIAFSLSAQSTKDEIGSNGLACVNPNSAECAHQRDLEDSGKRSVAIAWVAYGGAVSALVAGGLVWFFAPETRPGAGRTNVTPAVAPGIAGIRLQQTF